MQNGTGAATNSKTIRDYKPERRRTIDTFWPGTSKPLTLLYLHVGEQQRAYFAAREYFELKGQALDQIAEPQFQLEYEYQLVALMALQPGARSPAAKLFSGVDEVRAEVTPNESAALIEAHMDEQAAEEAGWRGRRNIGPIRQIARICGLDEEADPGSIVEAVAELRVGSDV